MLERILDAVSEPALQDLLKLGYMTQEYEVFGHIITLGNLTSTERQRVALKLNGLDLLARHPLEQVETLAISIKMIDGVDYSEGPNRVQIRIFLENSSDPVLSYLWDCYIKLISIQRVSIDTMIADVKKKLENPLSIEPSGKSSEPSVSEILETLSG